MNYFEQIDDYIMDRLSEADSMAFEKELKVNSELAEALEVQKKIKSGFEQYQRAEIKNRIKKGLETDAPSDNKGWKKFLWLILLLLALLASIFIVKTGAGEKQTGDEIFAQYYEPTPRFDIERTIVVNDSFMNQLYSHYLANDYSKIISETNNLDATELNNDLDFIKAISNIGLANNELAHQILQKIIDSDDPSYLDQCRWVKALLYLKQGNNSAAITLLTPMSNDPLSSHQQDALDILSRLE